jgi:hypothetical protein
VSERQERNHDSARYRRYIGRARVNSSASAYRQTRGAKRGRSINSSPSSRYAGSGTSSLTHPGWIAYRYIIIGLSTFGLAGGVTIVIAEWLMR